jgi:predicted 2-oxoglutarate/Fe(II)-dependent dioxygenase YbiX
MEIYRFENFISDEDNKVILDFIKDNPEWKALGQEKKFNSQQKNMLIRNNDNLHLKNINNMFDILDKYNKKIADTLYEKNLLTNNIFGAPPSLFRYKKGYNLPAHHDTRYSKWIEYASVIYYNDDYEGGNLNFPILNLSLKPKSKELIIFSQKTNDYLHEVERVTEGIRYSSATWWGSTGSEKEDLLEYRVDG